MAVKKLCINIQRDSLIQKKSMVKLSDKIFAGKKYFQLTGTYHRIFYYFNWVKCNIISSKETYFLKN